MSPEMLRGILIGGVLPGAIVTILLIAAWLLVRRVRPHWAAPLLIALAILPAELLVHDHGIDLWPRSGPDRVPHVALVLMLLALAEALTVRGARLGALLRVIGACAAHWMLLGVLIKPGLWSVSEGALAIGALVIGAAAVATIVEGIASIMPARPGEPEGSSGWLRAPRPGLDAVVVLFVAANAVPFVILNAGIAYHAQLAGGVVAALGACLATSIVVPRFTLTRGGITLSVLLLSGLLAVGRYYSMDGVPRVQILLCALAPLALLARLVPGVARLGWIPRAGVLGGLALIPSATAIVLSFLSAPPPSMYG